MLNRVIQYGFGLLSAFALLAAVGCGGSGIANLRVLNAAVNVPQVNILVDGNTVNSNLAYPGNTGYISVSAGSRHLQIEPVNSTTPIVDTTVSLGSSTNTTVIAAGVTTPITNPIVLTDDTTTPTSGTSNLRMVNAAPSMGSTDIYVVPDGTAVTGSPLVAGLAFGTASTYQPVTITAGTSANYDIYFMEPGTKLALLVVSAVNITSGSALTFVALDNTSGGGAFTYSALQDLQ
jgi:hypothetical protein